MFSSEFWYKSDLPGSSIGGRRAAARDWLLAPWRFVYFLHAGTLNTKGENTMGEKKSSDWLTLMIEKRQKIIILLIGQVLLVNFIRIYLDQCWPS